MTIFHVIKYPISYPITAEELLALPPDVKALVNDDLFRINLNDEDVTKNARGYLLRYEPLDDKM